MKTIAIISNPRKHEALKDIHEWLISNNIKHSVSTNHKKIFLKDLTLIFECESNYKGLRADGCDCWDDDIVNYITNGHNILENTTLESYILGLYTDKVIKKREGWLWLKTF